RDDDPSHAPAWFAHDRHRQGRLAAAAALEVRHVERRAGRALGCDRRLRPTRHLGVPLPHSSARRVRSWDVRDGDGAGGAEGLTAGAERRKNGHPPMRVPVSPAAIAGCYLRSATLRVVVRMPFAMTRWAQPSTIVARALSVV